VKHATTIDDSPPSNNDTWNDVAYSFLHRIVARPKILPYTYMVIWVVDNLDITDKTFINMKKTVILSFKVEYLRKMYHLPQSKKKYDMQFVQKFMQENLNPIE